MNTWIAVGKSRMHSRVIVLERRDINSIALQKNQVM